MVDEPETLEKRRENGIIRVIAGIRRGDMAAEASVFSLLTSMNKMIDSALEWHKKNPVSPEPEFVKVAKELRK